MKANEAPEKIYLQKYNEDTLICLNEWNISEEWSNKPRNEKISTNIEYTRTDAFIEKACDAYCKVCKMPNCRRTECNWISDFKEHLKTI